MNEQHTDTDARRTLVAVIVALTVASAAFRLFIHGRVEHTALVFVG